MNNIPARTKGIQSVRAIKRLVVTECVLLRLNTNIKMQNARPKMVKVIPPTFSHFHATISTAIKTNDGMRCIIKAPMFCQKVRSDEKESNANKLTKRIARIQIILGTQ